MKSFLKILFLLITSVAFSNIKAADVANNSAENKEKAEKNEKKLAEWKIKVVFCKFQFLNKEFDSKGYEQRIKSFSATLAPEQEKFLKEINEEKSMDNLILLYGRLELEVEPNFLKDFEKYWKSWKIKILAENFYYLMKLKDLDENEDEIKYDEYWDKIHRNCNLIGEKFDRKLLALTKQELLEKYRNYYETICINKEYGLLVGMPDLNRYIRFKIESINIPIKVTNCDDQSIKNVTDELASLREARIKGNIEVYIKLINKCRYIPDDVKKIIIEKLLKEKS